MATEVILGLEKKTKLNMKKISAPDQLLPTFGNDVNDARDSHPLVLDNAINFKYVIYERGKLIIERITKDLENFIFGYLKVLRRIYPLPMPLKSVKMRIKGSMHL